MPLTILIGQKTFSSSIFIQVDILLKQNQSHGACHLQNVC